jgi:hypothetical protein
MMQHLLTHRSSQTLCFAERFPAAARRIGYAVALLMTSMALGQALAAPPGAPVLVEPTAHIWYVNSQGHARLLLRADGLEAAALSQTDLLKSVKDLGSPDPGAVIEAITTTEIQAQVPGSRMWIFDLTVKGIPTSSNLPRYLTVTLGDKVYTLPYSLTNLPADKFTWTVKGPSTLALGLNAGIPISISMGSIPSTGLDVLHADLLDKSTHYPISEHPLHICQGAADCPNKSLQLKPYEPAQLLIWGTDHPGRFTGTITLATPEKPEGDSLSMTILVTSLGYQLAGTGVILLGVILSWFVTVFIKGRTDRDQLLLPVAALESSLSALKDLIQRNQTGLAAPNVTQRIAAIESALAIDKLEAVGLPNSVPTPWKPSSASQNLDTYRTYVQLQSDWTSGLQTVIQRGLVPIWAKWNATRPLPQQNAIATAVSDTDNLMAPAATAPLIGTLLTQLQTILNTLATALAPPAPAGVPVVAAAATQSSLSAPTIQELRVEISRMNMWTWIFLCVVTTLVGSYVLIFSEAAGGFGTWTDYLVCMIWGFGLTAGPQLLQSTTASVASTFGISR